MQELMTFKRDLHQIVLTKKNLDHSQFFILICANIQDIDSISNLIRNQVIFIKYVYKIVIAKIRIVQNYFTMEITYFDRYNNMNTIPDDMFQFV